MRLTSGGCLWESADQVIIAGDGYAYVTYRCQQTDPDRRGARLMLTRVDTSGVYETFTIKEIPYHASWGFYAGVGSRMITNADTGVLINWSADAWPMPWDDDGVYYHDAGMTITTGAGMSQASAPTVPGQCTIVYPPGCRLRMVRS